MLYQPPEPRPFNSNCHPVLGAIKALTALVQIGGPFSEHAVDDEILRPSPPYRDSNSPHFRYAPRHRDGQSKSRRHQSRAGFACIESTLSAPPGMIRYPLSGSKWSVFLDEIRRDCSALSVLCPYRATRIRKLVRANRLARPAHERRFEAPPFPTFCKGRAALMPRFSSIVRTDCYFSFAFESEMSGDSSSNSKSEGSLELATGCALTARIASRASFFDGG